MGLHKGQTNNPNGRKKGSLNKERKLIRDLITDAMVDECIDKLMELVRGIEVEGKDGKVYSQAPNTQAITYLLDQKFGKAINKTEITGKDGEGIVLILPEKEVLNPPDEKIPIHSN
jgi:hypothetical protein